MSRVAAPLNCPPEVEQELRRLSQSRTDEARVERAKMVLRCLAGARNDEVAAALGVRPGTVGRWRARFAGHGLAGLTDRARSGKPPTGPADLRPRLLRQLDEPPPAGFASWDGGMLAHALGVSDDAVWRVLRKEGIQLRRHRSWCVSTDPQCAAKAADIIGLYLNPPQNALVICVDEKPSIQALERKTGYVSTSSGKVVRGWQSTYTRHGTITLFAALRVATGTIQSKTTVTQKRPDFQAFLDEVVRDVRAETAIHVILDNDSTHTKSPAWLAQHPPSRFTSRRPRPVGSTRSKSGSAFSAARPCAVPALPAPSTCRRRSPPSWRPTTITRRRSSGESVEVTGSLLRNTIANLRNYTVVVSRGCSRRPRPNGGDPLPRT